MKKLVTSIVSLFFVFFCFGQGPSSSHLPSNQLNDERATTAYMIAKSLGNLNCPLFITSYQRTVVRYEWYNKTTSFGIEAKSSENPEHTETARYENGYLCGLKVSYDGKSYEFKWQNDLLTKIIVYDSEGRVVQEENRFFYKVNDFPKKHNGEKVLSTPTERGIISPLSRGNEWYITKDNRMSTKYSKLSDAGIFVTYSASFDSISLYGEHFNIRFVIANVNKYHQFGENEKICDYYFDGRTTLKFNHVVDAPRIKSFPRQGKYIYEEVVLF